MSLPLLVCFVQKVRHRRHVCDVVSLSQLYYDVSSKITLEAVAMCLWLVLSLFASRISIQNLEISPDSNYISEIWNLHLYVAAASVSPVEK